MVNENVCKSIGVFDSGVGGITVLKSLIKCLPNENFIYFGDNGNAPYGDKTTEEITNLCFRITDFLIQNNCKLIVIACNTAVASAYEQMISKYKLPIVGVISAGAKLAVEHTKNAMVGILATPFTVASSAYVKAIKDLDESISVYQSSCKLLCPMIETGWESHHNRYSVLEEYLSNIPSDVDTLVLGCTHYPIIKADIEKYFKNKVVDPSLNCAIETKEILEKMNLLNKDKSVGTTFYTSGDAIKFKDIVSRFLDIEIDKVTHIDLTE